MYRAGLHIAGRVACIVLAILMGACSSNVISIDPDDTATFGTFETSIPVTKPGDVRMKLRVSRVNGDYSQSVPGGKLIVINDNQIWGPTTVSGTSDLSYGSISIGVDDIVDGSGALQGKLRTSAYIGLARTNMDLVLVNEGTTQKINDRSTEVYLNGGMSYAITPEFYAGGTLSMSMGSWLTGIFETDLRLAYALFRHLQIIGGYRWLEYNYLLDDEDSSINVKFSGPFVGLYVPF